MEAKPKADPTLGAYLVINNQIFPLLKKVVKIGRKLENDLVINDETVSRWHAEIRYEEGEYVIHDRESTAGTFVNNKKIDRCILYSGDLIGLANVPLMFVNEDTGIANHAKKETSSLE